MAATVTTKDEPVTAIYSWTVKPGDEAAFQHMMHDIHSVARTFPGHMGVTTLRSPTQTRNFQTILRFDSTSHLEAWLTSPQRKALVHPLLDLVESDSAKQATGLETWFDLPGQLVVPPPRWKMATTTFIAIYPLSLLYSYFLVPHTLSLPVPVRSLFLPIFAPIILTYAFMPFLTRHVLKRWLFKAPGNTSGAAQ
jgi:antibiotic biosynthesis monooxygenase (ABM) superfamily enzyme